MAVNLVKNQEELLKCWKEVVDDKIPINWVLFTYEGQSYDLKVVGKGDGGITEMAEDLNSSKIMYAFCKVKDPKTSLPKNVLINWQGESAPAIRKGTCANHLGSIERFFKGIHVTINARTEDEVDEDYILDKVAKASGSAYTFNRSESKENDGQVGPVGAVYKRVIPSKEIDAKARDSFWAREEEEEKRRQAEDARRKAAERQRRDAELKQRELEGSRAREQQVQARARQIAELREAESRAAAATGAEKIKWAQQRQDDERDEEERRMRSENLRRQRSSEAQLLIKQRNIDARAIFEQNSAAGQLTSPTLLSASGSSLRKWPPSPTPMSPTPTSPTTPTPAAAAVEICPPPPPAPAVTEQPVAYRNGFASNESPTPPCIVPPAPGFADSPAPAAEPRQVAEVVEVVAEKEQVDSQPDWHSAAPAHVEPVDADDVGESTAASDGVVVEAVAAIADNSDAGVNGFGVRARALYDYQADDDSEISFDPGDIISHIDQIDPGWWQGMAPDGSYGLFPANYVELLDD